jgi:hypothetical protein
VRAGGWWCCGKCGLIAPDASPEAAERALGIHQGTCREVRPTKEVARRISNLYASWLAQGIHP